MTRGDDVPVKRPIVVLAGSGVVLGGLGAVGWHFQPVLPGLPLPPRLLTWMLPPKPDGPYYSGAIADDALVWWRGVPWWPVIVVLPVVGGALGATLAVAARRRLSVRPRSASHGFVSALPVFGGLGLLVAGLTVVAYHWEPSGGGMWASIWGWPVDVGYPVIGLLLGVAVAAAVGIASSR